MKIGQFKLNPDLETTNFLQERKTFQTFFHSMRFKTQLKIQTYYLSFQKILNLRFFKQKRNIYKSKIPSPIFKCRYITPPPSRGIFVQLQSTSPPANKSLKLFCFFYLGKNKSF